MPESKSGCVAPVCPSQLCVLGNFRLRTPDGADTGLPPLEPDERRLLALLALGPEAPATEAELAAQLWPGRSADVALGTLAGVCDSLGDLVSRAGGRPRLAEHLHVDLRRVLELLRSWERGPGAFGPVDELIGLLSQDVLPGWTEEWAVAERERFRRVRLHALESLCRRLTQVGRHEPAIRAGLLAVTADPLAEGARRALIEAHLAAGNVSEAVHQFEAFTLSYSKLGITPTPEFSAFLPPSPAWPVLHVRRPIHAGGPIGRGLRMEPPARRAQLAMGAGVRS